MPHKLITVHCLLITVIFLSSCQSTPTPPLQTTLLIYRFEPPAFVEYSTELQSIAEFPFSIPPGCGLSDTFRAPIGNFLAIELNCPSGQTVLFLDASASLNTGSASFTQPVTDSDSHFLAWTSDGKAAYLKVDSLGNPRVIRAYPDGEYDPIQINEFTYDLAARPDSRDFTFTFSRGLGYGSEIQLAQNDGRNTEPLYADPYNYISFARFSPDGRQIAFIKTPDSQTPFTVGELWVMDSDGSNPHKLADADAGHGYAADWSPDGKQIAFVVRENPEDENANQSSEALISNIYIVSVESGELIQVTMLTEGRAESPQWSPEGNTLAFQTVINGRMTVSIADAATGEIQSLETDIAPVGGSACCAAWMRK